jgi:hypothetical protein
MALKSKYKPGELAVCIESYVAAGDPDTPSYSRGLRLAADHPAVRKHGMYWVPESTPDDEILQLRHKMWRDAGAEAGPQ